jgi:hypothetical protein
MSCFAPVKGKMVYNMVPPVKITNLMLTNKKWPIRIHSKGDILNLLLTESYITKYPRVKLKLYNLKFVFYVLPGISYFGFP